MATRISMTRRDLELIEPECNIRAAVSTIPATMSLRRLAVVTLAFTCALAIRVSGITRHFWLVGDQIRDWSVALGPLTQLPSAAPSTHFGAYTIGPLFYWALWFIRATVGPWVEN